MYIHIPFCERKCRYCDFWSAPASFEQREEYVEQLIASIRREADGYKDRQVISIFFGGGTPSILEDGQLERILDTIYQSFQVLETAEITIEVNPGTVDKKKWKAYHKMGINRISIGAQSANDDELRLLGRIHTYEMFEKAYKEARQTGFDNINIDIISSLPGQTRESYAKTLHTFAQLEPEHISAYSLIIEEGTPFHKMFLDEKGNEKIWKEGGQEYQLLSEEADRDIYHLTGEILSNYGYDRYEISNYAKKGYECRHNVVYWRRGEYLGFGANAASLIDSVRYLNETTAPFAKQVEEVLSKKDQMSETMILGLRMIEGVSVQDFQEKYGIDPQKIYGDVICKFEKQGLLERRKPYGNTMDERIALTERGLDVANYIMADFMR